MAPAIRVDGDVVFDRELDCLAADNAPSLPVWSVRPGTVDAALAGLEPGARAFVAAAGFTGAAGQIRLVPGAPGNTGRTTGGIAGAMLGLGEDRSPFVHGGLAAALPGGTWRLEPGDFDSDGAVLGFCLGAYRFTALKTAEIAKAPVLLAGASAHAAPLAMARAAWLARDLVNTPANLLGPSELAGATQDLATRFGARSWLVEGPDLVREYPTVAAVGVGSERAPVVARLSWRGSGAGADAPLVALCGKGVCFDSGGYDLKPPSGMLRMKKDMGGAALLLALASAVMAADLPVRLEVWVGCAENMVSGRAFRPLDVLTTRRGLTVEVGNTDAEGRLVLCDLLAEASDLAPALLIDAATLTGAARVALGPDLPALFCNDDTVADAVLRLGKGVHDPMWRLPLWDGYDPWLVSGVADLNNVSSKPMAGAVTAALFLRRFVPSHVPWVHVDTYAWNDQTRPGRPEGGEALGLRALYATVRELHGINSGETSN